MIKRHGLMIYILVSLLKACKSMGYSMIDQEKTFEEDFKWDFIVDVKSKAKLNVARIGEKIKRDTRTRD
uniref:MATH domain-containing protein n=1 Tax=Setaria viridis TaxID=4556 RepID=A0A4U6SYC4_SETVI|nr:hypothetical protein SEVIR_9G204250v2 [Setaria viridis]